MAARLKSVPTGQREAPRRNLSVTGAAFVDAGSFAAGARARGRTSDTRLGELFLALLPGTAYYCLAFAYPAVTVLAGVGAAYAPQIVQAAAGLPVVKATVLAPLLHSLATTQPAATLLSVACSLLTAWLAFVAMPLGDVLLGRDLRNPSEDTAAAGEGSQAALYRGVLYLYCPVHLASLAVACHLVSASAVHPLAFLGATLSAGVAGGVLFTAAHELLHGAPGQDRACADALLAAVGYMHWTESHLQHHIKVATPYDPATARRGESLYAFVPRSVWGNLVDGYAAEASRLRRKGIHPLSPANRMWAWVLCPTALAAAAFLAFGPRGLAFAVGQAAASICMLEAVNYIEHYGLLRRRGPDGRFERVGPQHSWNANWMATSSFSFRLQRHADHHLFGGKPYQLLRDIPEAPQLPASYPAMMLVALLPPLFHRVMGARIDAYEAAAAARRAAAPPPPPPEPRAPYPA